MFDTARTEERLDTRLKTLLHLWRSAVEQRNDLLAELAGAPTLQALEFGKPGLELIVIRRPLPLEPEERAQ